jgi:hypothetical protein
VTTEDSGAPASSPGSPVVITRSRTLNSLIRSEPGVIRSTALTPSRRYRDTPIAQHASPSRRRAGQRRQRRARLAAGPWPLPGILVIQAALSVRLVWSNTAFQDEGLYLWSGHLEWSHWLHGGPLPPSLTEYLSGAPVIYPPLGALADSLGGLAAARGLSLCFMLGATTLLHGVTRRLFGRRAALFAAGLFAGAGSVQFLGALATYDAMALFLLALATWTGVLAAGTGLAGRNLLLVTSGTALAAADAAKYAATLFDPVVLLVITLHFWRRRGPGPGLAGVAVVCMSAVAVISGGLWAGGPGYLHGIAFTTLARQPGSDPAPGILFASAKWVGLIAVAALIGAAAVPRLESPGTKALAWCLAGAVFLAPAAQARINVITSLFKHVAYGAWFGSVIAGYGLAALASAVPASKVKAALRASVAFVLIAAGPGVYLASFHFSGWPGSAPLMAALNGRVSAASGPMLMDTPSVEEYYMGSSLNWRAVVSTYYFAYADPRTGKYITSPAAAYSAAIQNRYFSLITLSYGTDATGFDAQIRSAIARYGGYRLVSDIPFRTSANDGQFLIWVRSSTSARSR